MDTGIALTILDVQDGVTVSTDSRSRMSYRRLQMAHHCPNGKPLAPGAVVTVQKTTEDGSMLIRTSCGCDHLLYEPVRRPPPAHHRDDRPGSDRRGQRFVDRPRPGVSTSPGPPPGGD
jgi:hypothetical protein